MASAEERLEFTNDEIAGLTDSEVVGIHRSILAEIQRLRQVLEQAGDSAEWFAEIQSRSRLRRESAVHLGFDPPQSSPTTDDEFRYERSASLRFRLESEMDRRLPGMLQAARLALGLTHREVSRGAGIHSKFVDEIERGRTWSKLENLFARACTEGGLDPVDERIRHSVWFPLADPRLCRTIRQVAIDPCWLSRNDGAVASLARSIRDDRAFDLLPSLGDALEETGCADADILAHCRTPGMHIRGCWVADALVRAGRRS